MFAPKMLFLNLSTQNLRRWGFREIFLFRWVDEVRKHTFQDAMIVSTQEEVTAPLLCVSVSSFFYVERTARRRPSESLKGHQQELTMTTILPSSLGSHLVEVNLLFTPSNLLCNSTMIDWGRPTSPLMGVTQFSSGRTMISDTLRKSQTRGSSKQILTLQWDLFYKVTKEDSEKWEGKQWYVRNQGNFLLRVFFSHDIH